MYAHFLFSQFYFFINPNLCLESGVCTFQALFCVYATVIREAPGLEGGEQGSEEQQRVSVRGGCKNSRIEVVE